jgi:hypothetical protein
LNSFHGPHMLTFVNVPKNISKNIKFYVAS